MNQNVRYVLISTASGEAACFFRICDYFGVLIEYTMSLPLGQQLPSWELLRVDGPGMLGSFD
jgi:hypothetical protein